ncbi:MAG: histidinol-phosphatase [Candidatus Acidiferrum sp.]
MGYQAEYGALLESIAEEADAIAMKYFRATETRVERKLDGTAVTQADREVEQMARSKVSESGLALEVLGEELGGDARSSALRGISLGSTRLIIDPIDGTEEFSRGIPTFGTLLGIERDAEIIAGMASAPALRVRWWAYRGEGAYRNGRKIRVSRAETLASSMVFTTGGGPSKNAEARAKLRRLADAARNARALGGFWQHVLVAEGAIEAAVDLTSKPWDLAPLGIIVEEAGGTSTNINGQRTIYTGDFVSTNGKFHEEVLRLLR